MKYNYYLSILIAVFFLKPAITFSQWTDVSPSSGAGVLLFGIGFITEDVGFAVGQNTTTGVGYVFKTTDGGSNWTEETFPDHHLRSVAFTDANNGIIGGYDGPPGTEVKWITTTDQGASWVSASDNQFKGVNGIQFVDGQVGFSYGYGSMFGSTGGIMKTVDGGKNWTFQSDSPSLLIEGMHFIDANTGFLSIADFSATGSIMKTTDGGVTFTSKYSGDWMRSVTFVGNNTGYAIEGLSSKSLVKTTDGGETWNVLAIDDKATRLAFVTENLGYAIGDEGAIFKTTDGGENWTDESPGITEDFEGFSIVGNYVYACGRNGTVFKTEYGVFTGIEKADEHRNRLTILPNPLQVSTSIEVQGVDQPSFLFTLFSATGQLLIEKDVRGRRVDLSDAHLSGGIYFYQIQTTSNAYSGKIVVDL